MKNTFKNMISKKGSNNISNNLKKNSFLGNAKKKLALMAVAACYISTMLPSTVFASGDTSTITQPLTNLKTLVISIIAAVGVIIIAKNVMEFAQAYQQQDSSTMNSAIKGIVAGVIMAGISTVLTFLGF